jgi:hypothetical protein
MLKEERSPDTKISFHKINDGGGDLPFKSDMPYEFENLGDPLRTTAAGGPISEHFVTCNCTDQMRGCLLQIIILQRLFNLLYSLG